MSGVLPLIDVHRDSSTLPYSVLHRLIVAQGVNKFSTFLCNPNVHYSVHKSVLLVHTLSLINPLHTLTIRILYTNFGRGEGGGERKSVLFNDAVSC